MQGILNIFNFLIVLQFILDCWVHCRPSENWKWSGRKRHGQFRNHSTSHWPFLWVRNYYFCFM